MAEIRHNLDINLMNEQLSRHIWLNYVPPPPPPLAATSIPVHWYLGRYTVIRFVSVSAKVGTCTVVMVNGTLAKDKMRRFKGECAHFNFNKCPIYTHDGASAKFSTISHQTDNSVLNGIRSLQHTPPPIFFFGLIQIFLNF